MAQKFIITNTQAFRFGNVGLHRELLKPGEDCLGGGFYEFDYSASCMLLSGKSYDYGRPKWGMIDELILPASLAGIDITYEGLPLSDFVTLKYL